MMTTYQLGGEVVDAAGDLVAERDEVVVGEQAGGGGGGGAVCSDGGCGNGGC